ncbi:MAG TPA: recombination protein RecR [Candidatus Magasanikbacteria bacterium]|nr:recombination protein RecR [Candidatus Magasanikbacteria bacterium]
MFSKSIQQLITAFSKLPSVGERTAERYVFYLLKSGKKDAGEITLALKNLIDTVKSCEICWDFSDSSPCTICSDKKRDTKTICVVAEPQDIQAIEKTDEYNGLYHVLRGVIKADDDELNNLKIKELITRAKTATEIIFALNPDLNGENTTMYLIDKLKTINPKLKLTRLARGLPMGSDLQYADEITLGSAIKNRK